MLSLDHGLDPETLWFTADRAIGSVIWELPGTNTELAVKLKYASEAADRDGSSSFTCEHDDLNGNRRRYDIGLSRLEHTRTNGIVAHIVIADRTLEGMRELERGQARSYYRGLFLESPDAIACVEHERPGISPKWPLERQIDAFFAGRFADCNDAYARRLGRRHRDEVIGRKVHEVLPRTTAGIDLLTRIIENGYKLQGWFSPRARDREASPEPINHITCTAEFEESRVVRTWNVFRDVTDELGDIDAVTLGAERHESLLLAEESYFCFEFDPPIDTKLPVEEQARRILSGRLVECNDTYARSCGADSPEAVIGMTMQELTPRSVVANEDERVTKSMIEYIENGYKLENNRQEFNLPDGARFVSIVNCRGVIRHGQLTHHWAMLRDLSEREAQIRDLQRSEARFERMAQHSPALIYRLRVDDEFGFEFINDAICSISGYPRDDQRINDYVLHEIFSAENLELLISQIESEDSGPVLTRHMHRSGNIVFLEHRVVPVRNSKGRLLVIEGVALDVTERLNSQQQLQTALSEISKLSDALQQEHVQLREEIRSVCSFDLIVGNSPPFRKVIELASRAAPTGSTILILGETGTGKELFARSIHQSSTRSDKPMISVNCAALPPTLIESELFGHTKGAFTGADEPRIGRFEAADGGTVFLDEIGELSLELQAKLLRVVQEGEFQRLGDSKTIKVDVRLIAATNSDLAAAVERGEFRADLFYRLNVVPIVLPPLRERPDDIPILANHFAVKHSHRLGKTFEALSPEFLQSLVRHDWPGNVRELESVIERSLIISPGSTLQPVKLRSERRKTEVRPVAELTRTAEVFQRSLHDAERHHILRTLEQSDWVIEGSEGAAARLGIAPSTLRSKIKKLGISRPKHGDAETAALPGRRIH